MIFLLITCVLQAGAHDPGLSTIHVRLQSERIDIALGLSLKDAGELIELDRNHDGRTTRDELAAGEAALAAKAADALEIVLDRQPASMAAVTCRFDSQGNASLVSEVTARVAGTFQLRSHWLALLPSGHRQFLSIENAHGKVLAEHLLSANSDSAELVLADDVASSVAGPSTGDSFVSFFVLGLKHILIGYDHLLFLFSLLIVSRSLGATLKVITCFTVAHSITLALATFDLVQIPGRWVEPLIAASIVFVAVENLVRGGPSPSRMWLVFAFGLIHGLGFASVLRELGMGTGAGVTLPLVSFNLGVEIGQLLVAAPLVPLIRVLHRYPAFRTRWIPACSTLAALAGGVWLFQRW